MMVRQVRKMLKSSSSEARTGDWDDSTSVQSVKLCRRTTTGKGSNSNSSSGSSSSKKQKQQQQKEEEAAEDEYIEAANAWE